MKLTLEEAAQLFHDEFSGQYAYLDDDPAENVKQLVYTANSPDASLTYGMGEGKSVAEQSEYAEDCMPYQLEALIGQAVFVELVRESDGARFVIGDQ